MNPEEVIETEWPFLLTLLPAEWERQAKELGALQRPRGVPSAAALLHLAFAYAGGGWSVRATALWAREAGVAALSGVALWKRLRHAAPWLGWLVMAQLRARAALPALPGGLRVRLVDATVVSKPGSHGTDFRVHLGLDLGRLLIDDLELTLAGGESFQRLHVQPGDVVVAAGAQLLRPGQRVRVLDER